MSIKFQCPNGHSLRAKESLAGKRGICPVCDAPIRVPLPAKEEFSDSEIVRFIGEAEPGKSPRETAARRGDFQQRRVGVLSAPPKKNCPNCDREIASGHHICPYCRTYIAALTDF